MLAFTWKVSSADVRAAGGRENKFQKGGHAMRVEAVFPALLLPVVNQRERHDGRRVYKDTALRGGSLCLVFSSFFLSFFVFEEEKKLIGNSSSDDVKDASR